MKIATIFIAFILCVSVASQADPKHYRLPVGSRLVLSDAIYQGYTFDEMKILLKMDSDLLAYEKNIRGFKSMIESFEIKDIAKDKIIESKNTEITTLKTYQDHLFSKWSGENKARHECENRPSFGSWIAWGSAGIATVTAIILGTILALKISK